MTLRDTIRAARKAAGMTQDKLGHLCDVTESAVSNWETGKNNIDPKHILRLSAVFGIPIGVLMGEIEPDINKPAGLTAEEYAVVKAWRAMHDDTRKALVQMFDALDRTASRLENGNNESAPVSET